MWLISITLSENGFLAFDYTNFFSLEQCSVCKNEVIRIEINISVPIH